MISGVVSTGTGSNRTLRSGLSPGLFLRDDARQWFDSIEPPIFRDETVGSGESRLLSDASIDFLKSAIIARTRSTADN